MPGSAGVKKGLSGAAAAASKPRPSFSELLQGVLRPQSELRVWWDDSLGYQPVRQTCVPTSLPQVRVSMEMMCLFCYPGAAQTSTVGTYTSDPEPYMSNPVSPI